MVTTSEMTTWLNFISLGFDFFMLTFLGNCNAIWVGATAEKVLQELKLAGLKLGWFLYD